MNKLIHPTGSVCPRYVYELPKVHKPEPIPLRRILLVVGSAQHVCAWWLAYNRSCLSTRAVATSSRTRLLFVQIWQESGNVNDVAYICLFDVFNLLR